MSESLAGRKVRLIGILWDGVVPWPANGEVHEIISEPSDRPDRVHIKAPHRPGQHYYVVLDRDADDFGDWGGVLVEEAPEVRPYVVGFLDGLLGLHRQDVGGDYDQGYERGRSVRVAIS